MKTPPDLWNTCYDGQARQIMSPESFRSTFCDDCMQIGCRNSKGSKMSWVQRMATQADRLLHNPNFANTDDPQFREIAGMDFQDRLREALAIEIADRKGDWSVPTNQEIGEEAAVLVGISPSGFTRTLREEDPKPPERLVDEVGLSDIPERATTSPGSPDQVRGLDKVLVQIDDYQPLGRWRVRGSSGKIWDVTQVSSDTWECTCPSKENPCKHARDIQQRMIRSAPPAENHPPAPPKMPPPAPRGPAGLVRGNTKVPEGGVVLGGPAPAPVSDPWAPTQKPTEIKVPVGGKVRFGKRKP